MTNDRQSDRQTGRQNELDMQTEPDKQTDSVTVFVDSQNVNGKILQASCRYKRFQTAGAISSFFIKSKNSKSYRTLSYKSPITLQEP